MQKDLIDELAGLSELTKIRCELLQKQLENDNLQMEKMRGLFEKLNEDIRVANEEMIQFSLRPDFTWSEKFRMIWFVIVVWVFTFIVIKIT